MRRIVDKIKDNIVTNDELVLSRAKAVGNVPPMTVMTISSVDETNLVADILLAQGQVIMNLESADPKSKQRCLNFMKGVCYYTDGNIVEVMTNIYLIQGNGNH